MSEENSKEIEDLKRALRQKRNAAQAGLFVAVIIVILSAGWIYMQGESNSHISQEAGEVVVTADSLNQIKSKIEEQQMHIETQDEEIARMREEMSEAQNGSSEIENAETGGEETMDDSQAANAQPISELQGNLEDFHVIEKGETLWSIAERYFNDGHRNVELAANNGISDASHILVGETLRLQ